MLKLLLFASLGGGGIIGLVLSAADTQAGWGVLTGVVSSSVAWGVMQQWNKQLVARLDRADARDEARWKAIEDSNRELTENSKVMRALITPLNKTAEKVSERVPATDQLSEVADLMREVRSELSRRPPT